MYKWWNLLSFVVLLNAFFFFVVVAADWRFYLTERDFVKPETIFLYTSFMMIRCVHNALYSVIHRIYTECMHICKWFSQGVCRCVEFTLFVVVVVFKKYTECDHQRFSVLRCLCVWFKLDIPMVWKVILDCLFIYYTILQNNF